jgi:hypothetical protein
MKFKEFRVIDGVVRPVYTELKTGKEKYLVSRIRKIKDKTTKEEMEILMGMDWHYTGVITSQEYNMNWLEKRLFEAERKLAKIENVLGKEKFEEALGC